MKDFIKYFLLAFIPLLVYGFYNGYGQRKEVVRAKLYQDIRLRGDGERFYFVNYCDDQPAYTFDVDSDTLRRPLEFSAMAASARLEDAPSERHLEYKELVGAFLGGSGALVTFKDFDKLTTQKSSIIKVVATAVGGVSGYLLGKWLGSHYATGCDSQLAIEILENKGEWQAVEQTYVKFSLMGMKWRGRPLLFGDNAKNMNPVGEDPLFEIDSPLKQDFEFLKQRCESIATNFASPDFHRLLRIKKVYATLVNQDVYKSLLFNHERKVLKSVTIQKPAGYFAFSPQKWDSTVTAAKAAIEFLYTEKL
jgi:hypothetical protein